MPDDRVDLSLWNLLDAVASAVDVYYNGLPAPWGLPAPPAVDLLPAAADGPLVSIGISRTFGYVGDIRQEQSIDLNAVWQKAAEVQVTIIRPWPGWGESALNSPLGVEPPAAALVEAHAQVVYADESMVFNAIVEAYGRGDLPGCGGVQFMGWAQVAASAGLAGGISTVRVAVN